MKVLLSTSPFQFPIGEIKHGKYGEYASINGLNYSLKKAKEIQYEIADLPMEDVARIKNEYFAKQELNRKKAREIEMDERAQCVDNCLKCVPVEIKKLPNTICLTASLSESEMLQQYHGCGKGTAYVVENKVIAFHYGYEQPYFTHPQLDMAQAVKIELSGCQICFF